MEILNQKPKKTLNFNSKEIDVFIEYGATNAVIKDFGEEWEAFNEFKEEEIQAIGDEYFDLLDKNAFKDKTAIDFGGGTGRWTRYISNYFKKVYLVEPSKAIFSSTKVLEKYGNVRFIQATIERHPFKLESVDFAMSLGVLHHIENTEEALLNIYRSLKPQGIFYFYLYHNLESSGIFNKLIFNLVNILRLIISILPFFLKKFFAFLIALCVYWPLSKLSLILGNKTPLSYYRNKSFYIMRNDALDRFGTKLEKRYSKKEIERLLHEVGFSDVVFSSGVPYYHGYCIKQV